MGCKYSYNTSFWIFSIKNEISLFSTNYYYECWESLIEKKILKFWEFFFFLIKN